MQAHPSEFFAGKIRKILVLETDQVFGGFVMNLIANHEHLSATSLRISPETDLLAEVRQQGPDVVVVDDFAFPRISASLFVLLKQFPSLKIIVLCTQENNVEVYTKQLTAITQSKDLIDVL